jgi:hypothetical protein
MRVRRRDLLQKFFADRGPHLAAIRSSGLKLRIGDEVRVCRPTATSDPRELGPQDYVLVCLKAHQAWQVADQMAPLLGPDTVVVTGQNGVVFLSRTGGLLSGIVEIPGQGRTILMEQAGGRIVVTRFEGNTPLRCSFDGPADLGAVDCTAAGLSEIRVLVLYDDRVASGGGRQTLDQFIPALTLHANNILANSQIEAALRIVDIRPFDIVEQLRLIDDLALVTGSSLSELARHASAFLRADLKKVYQCVSGFFWLFFQDPMTSAWQYNYGDAIRDEFHLRAELVA